MELILDYLERATQLGPMYYIIFVVSVALFFVLAKYTFNRSYAFSIVGSLILFLFCCFVAVLFTGEKGNAQLTVYVHGPEGRQQVILENAGQLVVDFGNDRRIQQIGQHGRTNFGEIPNNFVGKVVEIGLEAPGFEVIDAGKKDTLNGQPLYIGIRRDNSLGKIVGVVKNEQGNQFLDSVEIRIGIDTIIYTDKQGRFRIILPENMRVTDKKTPYHLVFMKGGKMKEENYYAGSNDIEVRL